MLGRCLIAIIPRSYNELCLEAAVLSLLVNKPSLVCHLLVDHFAISVIRGAQRKPWEQVPEQLNAQTAHKCVCVCVCLWVFVC